MIRVLHLLSVEENLDMCFSILLNKIISSCYGSALCEWLEKGHARLTKRALPLSPELRLTSITRKADLVDVLSNASWGAQYMQTVN